MTSKGTLDGMQVRDKKDREKAAMVARTEKAEKAKATRAKKPTSGPRYTCSTSHSSPLSAYGYPTRILRSVTRFIPRPNYSLPPLTELHTEDESDLESLISAASFDCKYRRPRTSTAHPAPEKNSNTPQLGKPLPRNLSSSKWVIEPPRHRQHSPTGCCIQLFAFFSFFGSVFLFVSSGFWLGRWSAGLVEQCARTPVDVSLPS